MFVEFVCIIIGLLVIYFIFSAAREPRINKKIPAGKIQQMRSGSLYADGSTTTSGAEKIFRNSLQKSGFSLLPSSTRIITPPDQAGVKHSYTPDIILRNRKLIIEFDPHFHHGSTPGKIKHDIDRNIMFSRMGYTIVRVRVGGAFKLCPNDVIIHQGSFTPERDAKKVKKAIKSAKFYPPKYFFARKKEFDKTFTVKVR